MGGGRASEFRHYWTRYTLAFWAGEKAVGERQRPSRLRVFSRAWPNCRRNYCSPPKSPFFFLHAHAPDNGRSSGRCGRFHREQ
jgi:hypothetical protein